jgi:RimJ/RimL family protein N-acetyltransferase
MSEQDGSEAGRGRGQIQAGTRGRCEIRRLVPGDEAAITGFLARHADGSVFLRANLQAAGLAYHGNPLEGVYVGAFDDGALEGVAAHYRNGALILQAPEHAGALARAAVEESGRVVAALIGPWAQVSAARTALDAAEWRTSLDSREVLMRLLLRDLRAPAALTGGRLVCRRSRPSDLEGLAAWHMAYLAEALNVADTPTNRSRHLPMLMRAHEAGDLFALEDGGRVVSTCSFNAPAGDTVQIGGVWTPPELRSRGYARAVVAGALLTAQENGVETAVLFTGENNTAALRAYQKIGFAPVGDYGLVFFDDI